jgi:hypothetical protein
MPLDDHIELQERVLALTWKWLRADAASAHGPAFSTPGVPAHGAARRFSSHIAFEQMRDRIRGECRDAGAPRSLEDYFSTHWLRQFAPMAM